RSQPDGSPSTLRCDALDPVEIAEQLLGAELGGVLAALEAQEAGALVVRLDARREQADGLEVGDEAAEHHVAELAHAGGGGDQVVPVAAGQDALEPLLVDLVSHEAVAHQEGDLEGPVLPLAPLLVRELVDDVLLKRQDAVVDVARLVLDDRAEERLEQRLARELVERAEGAE